MGSNSNAYCEAVAAISASCVAFSVTDLATCRERGSRERYEISTESGHAPNIRAAITNLAHLELLRGHFVQSRALLRTRKPDFSARRTASRRESRTASPSSHLASEDIPGAESILADVGLWTPDSPKGTWYYGLWTSVTRAKLLLKQGRCDEAAAMLSAAVGGASELADPLLTAVLRLLLVEAQRARRPHARAAARSSPGTFTPTGRPRSNCSPSSGASSAARSPPTGRPAPARWWFERGGRALASVGHRTALANLVDGYADAVGARTGRRARLRRSRGADRLPAAAAPPRRRTGSTRARRCSPPADNPAAVALERAAAIVDAGAYPAVVGHEVMAALLETRSRARRRARRAARQSSEREVLSWFGAELARRRRARRPPAARHRARALAGPRLRDRGGRAARRSAASSRCSRSSGSPAPPGSSTRRATTSASASRSGRSSRTAGGDDVIACSAEMLERRRPRPARRRG